MEPVQSNPKATRRPTRAGLSLTGLSRIAYTVFLVVVTGCRGTLDGPTQPAPTYPLYVSVSTVGYTQGSDFVLRVDGTVVGSISGTGAVSIPNLSAGPHLVVLETRPDCRSTDLRREVVLSAAASIRFEVVCYGTGMLKVFTESHGAAPYTSHWLELEIGEFGVGLVSNGTTTVSLIAGPYAPTFYAAPNCTALTPPSYVTVVRDSVTELTLRADCSPVGTLRVSTTLSGSDLPDAVSWEVPASDTVPGERLVLHAGQPTDLMLAVGEWTGRFVDLPVNCLPITADPTTFSISEEQVSELALSVACARYRGSLRVVVEATGASGPFGLGINGSCTTVLDFLNDMCSAWLYPSASVTIDLDPGTYRLSLIHGGNCVLSPAQPVTIEIQTAAVTDVRFTAVCS